MDINLLTEAEAATLKSEIAASDSIIMCCHQNADGDALGSCLAMAEYVRQQGKDPVVVVPDMCQLLGSSHYHQGPRRN